MGTRKRFQSTAVVRIGRKPSGLYKLYVVGKVRNAPGMFWIVAGSGAQRPPLRDFETQKTIGYGTKEEVKTLARRLFPTRQRFTDFIGNDLGSDPLGTIDAELEPEVLEPWEY